MKKALYNFLKVAVKNASGYFGIEIRRGSSKHATPITAQWLGNFYYFVRLYGMIENVPGDIVECGIGRGRTFLYLAFLLSTDKKPRTLWGFDSFAGFPEPSPEDKSHRNTYKGERNTTTLADIKWLLLDAGISKDMYESQVKVIPGFFEKTLTQYSGEKIAFLHLDVDLYQAYKECLEELYPKVVSGGVVLFDEYDDPAFPGGGKAIRDYFKGKNVEVKKDSLSGKHYIVKP